MLSNVLRYLHKSMTKRSVAFGATSFGASLMGSIFGLYRVDLFTSVYKLDSSYFYSCQLIYAIWNAVNDPLFGWLIDNTSGGSSRRLPAIKYGGPLWALTFLLPWWPWGEYKTNMFMLAFQFCFCLSAYDAFLTYVLLVHCALFADITTDNKERNQLNIMRTIGGILGSVIGSFSYLFWDKQDLGNFRVYCIAMAGVAANAFWYSGCNIKVDRMDRQHELEKLEKSKGSSSSNISSYQFSKQVFRQKNFWMYVILNFMQNFNITFNSSYWIFLMDKVINPIFPAYARKAFVFISFYFPHAVVPLLTPFVNRYGKYEMIQKACFCKLIISCFLLVFDVKQWYLWAPLFLLNGLLHHSWGFYDLIMADVIDEDMVLNKRKKSMSTSMHGIQALFVKPAQSLAPVIGVYYLTEYAINHSVAELEEDGILDSVQHVAYGLFAKVTFISAVIQLFVWRFYTLHGPYMAKVKKELNEAEGYKKGIIDAI